MDVWNETTLVSKINAIYGKIIERTFLVASNLDEEHVTREVGLQMAEWFQTTYNGNARGSAWVDLYKAYPDVFKRNFNGSTKLLPDYWEVIQIPDIESSSSNLCVALTKPNFEQLCGFDVLWHFHLPTTVHNTWARLTLYLQAKLCHYTQQGPEVDFTYNECEQLVALLKTYYDFAPDDVSTPLPGYLVYDYDPDQIKWGLYFIPAQHIRQALIHCHEQGNGLLGANHNRPYQNRLLTEFFLTENYRLEKWLNTTSDTNMLEGFDVNHSTRVINLNGTNQEITFAQFLEVFVDNNKLVFNLPQNKPLQFLGDVYSKLEVQYLTEGVKERLQEMNKKERKKKKVSKKGF